MSAIPQYRGRTVAAVSVAALLATGVAVHGTSSAAATTKTMNITCNTPAGAQKMATNVTFTAPTAVKVGETVNPTLTFTNTVPAATAQQLAQLTGANGLDFTGTFHDTWSGAATGDAMGMVTVKGVMLPAGGGDVQMTGMITYANPATPTAAGQLTLSAGAANVALTPLKDGKATALGTVQSACTIDAGQDTNLFTVTVA